MKIHKSHKKIEDLILSTQGQTDVINVVTPSTEKVLDVHQESTSVIFARRWVILIASATEKEIYVLITKGPLVHSRHIS